VQIQADDTLNQIQLRGVESERTFLSYSTIGKAVAGAKAASFAIASLQHFNYSVKENHKGRHENMVRAAEYSDSITVFLLPRIRVQECKDKRIGGYDPLLT